MLFRSTGNAIWGMRFVWPIKAEYVISHVDATYSETIIARSSRDYVWIMARTPSISAERYQSLVEKVGALGYDVGKLRKVPHNPLPSAAKVPAEAVQSRLGSAAGAPVLLDVRTPEEFAAGHLPGAKNIPYDQIPSRIRELKSVQDSEIVVYCRTGRRAGIAIDILSGAGFRKLGHLDGDYEAWSAAGRPVSTSH